MEKPRSPEVGPSVTPQEKGKKIRPVKRAPVGLCPELIPSLVFWPVGLCPRGSRAKLFPFLIVFFLAPHFPPLRLQPFARFFVFSLFFLNYVRSFVFFRDCLLVAAGDGSGTIFLLFCRSSTYRKFTTSSSAITLSEAR